MRRKQGSDTRLQLLRPLALATLLGGGMLTASVLVVSPLTSSPAFAVEGQKGLDAENQALLAEEAALLEKVNLSNLQAPTGDAAAAPAPSATGPDLERTSLGAPQAAGVPESVNVDNIVPKLDDAAPAAAAVDMPQAPVAEMPQASAAEVPQVPIAEAPQGRAGHQQAASIEGVRAARMVDIGSDEISPNSADRRKAKAPAAAPRPVTAPKSALPEEGLQPIQGSSPGLDLEQRLQAAHARNLRLMEALDDARRRLLAAETEIERLSAVVESRSPRYRNGGAGMGSPALAANRGGSFGGAQMGGPGMMMGSAGTSRPQVTAVRNPSHMPAASSGEGDMTGVTVTAEKANLRSGPGLNNSPLMTVPRGTRLVVERREGDWYRVVTPNGSRAWVTGAVVTFGAQDGWSPSSVVRVKSFDPNAEDAAFELLQKDVSGKGSGTKGKAADGSEG